VQNWQHMENLCTFVENTDEFWNGYLTLSNQDEKCSSKTLYLKVMIRNQWENYCKNMTARFVWFCLQTLYIPWSSVVNVAVLCSVRKAYGRLSTVLSKSNSLCCAQYSHVLTATMCFTLPWEPHLCPWEPHLACVLGHRTFSECYLFVRISSIH
jgi:hypothetical protein